MESPCLRSYISNSQIMRTLIAIGSFFSMFEGFAKNGAFHIFHSPLLLFYSFFVSSFLFLSRYVGECVSVSVLVEWTQIDAMALKIGNDRTNENHMNFRERTGRVLISNLMLFQCNCHSFVECDVKIVCGLLLLFLLYRISICIVTICVCKENGSTSDGGRGKERKCVENFLSE